MTDRDYSSKPFELNGTRAPYEIHGVSTGFFSVARYYGGCKAFGTEYVYDPTEDVLVRKDCLKIYAKAKRDVKDDDAD